MTCICTPKTEHEAWLLEHCGCPEEICPACYCTKRHDSRLCLDCALFQRAVLRAAWPLVVRILELCRRVSVRLAQ